MADVGWMTRTGSPITTRDEICGKQIGVAKGTNQEMLATNVANECVAKGISGTEVVGFSNTLMTVPLEAERVDVIYDSTSSVLHFAETEGDKFAMLGRPEIEGAIAFGVLKGDRDKAELLRDAAQSLVEDGTYAAVFEHWGLASLQLDKIYINNEGFELDKFQAP